MLLDRDPGKYSGSYNFGPFPDDHLTVRELVEAAIKYWGEGKWSGSPQTNQPHEAGLLKLDITRAKNVLGWQPKLTAAEAIKWTIDWYKTPAPQLAEFSFNQVRNYFN
jgi:CDP-glucose 4,6-dehydratase